MKRIKKSDIEPECLTTFRTDNPNGKWDDLKNQLPPCYNEIKKTAGQDQKHICAFCEIEIAENNIQIAHFHPKEDISPDINWALHWKNLLYACKGGDQPWMSDPRYYLPPTKENTSCDQKKANLIVDDTVIHPYEIPAFPNIFNFLQYPGEVHISANQEICEQIGISVEILKNTIDVFNLNCTRLARARMSIHSGIQRDIKMLRASHYSSEDIFQLLCLRHLAPYSSGDRHNYPYFFTLRRWLLKQPAESYLESIGYDG